MVVYAETALEKDAPAASDLAHQEVAGTSVQLNAICMYWDAYPSLGPSLGFIHCQAMTRPAMSAEEDDDDETCGFCIFMKAGGCKDEFKVRLRVLVPD